MKTSWVIGILLMLFLAACAPQAMPAKKGAVPLEEAETAPAMEKEPAQTEVRTAPTRPLPSERVQTPPPTEVQVESKVTMSPALRDLLKRADEKLSSLQYLYGGTDTNNLFLNTYLVKGTKMRIKLYEEDYYVREGYYDNVYLDSAVGCCEESSRCKSHNINNMDKKFDVDASMLKIPKTPYQWVKEVPASAQIIGPQTVNSRSVTFTKYTDASGQEVQMWIDDTYGVPHKVVEVKNGNEIKHQFNDMVFNSLKDADFVAPCA